MRKRLLTLHLILIICVVTLVTRADHSQANMVQDQTGPALGDTLELMSWRTRDGRTLADVIKGHSLTMVLLVDPSCGTCAEAKEGFRTLRDGLAKPGIPYVVLMIPDGADAQKYFSYSDSLKMEAESFVWSNTTTKPPTSLATMAVPSHLLITNQGLIVNKWPGTTPAN